jgi:CheY-like chemotaxis protein
VPKWPDATWGRLPRGAEARSRRNRALWAGTSRASKPHVHALTIESDGTPSRKYRLLIAEDDQAFRDLLVTLFKADGHDVVAVTNGRALMDTLAASSDPQPGSAPFDLVISDVRMPGATGLQVLAQTAGARKIPPFIFITAFGGEDLHAEAEQLGALAIVDKPFDFDDLRAFVDNFFATRAP